MWKKNTNKQFWTLGMKNQSYQNMSISKVALHFSYTSIFNEKKMRRIRAIFDIEKWLWKSKLCSFRPKIFLWPLLFHRVIINLWLLSIYRTVQKDAQMYHFCKRILQPSNKFISWPHLHIEVRKVFTRSRTSKEKDDSFKIDHV